MEHESSVFDLNEFQLKWMSMELGTNNANFDKFALDIISNINQFARQNKTDLVNHFSQYESKVRQKIRTSLSNELLAHVDFDEAHLLKKTTSSEKLNNDINDLIILITATPEEVKQRNLTNLYEIKPNEVITISTLQQLYEQLNKNITSNHKIVLQQLKNSKNTIIEQSKQIASLKNSNEMLETELKSVQTKLETINKTLNDKDSFPAIPKVTTNNFSTFSKNVSSNLITHTTPLNPNQSKKRSNTESENPIAYNNASAAKKPLYSKISNSNNNNNQKMLFNFNSFDKNSKNTPITNYTNNSNNGGFIVAGQKEHLKKQRNFQKKQYNRSVGMGSSDETIARKRKFFVYFGNIALTVEVDKVKEIIEKALCGIQYEDFIELNGNSNDRKFKSFKFSIGYLDKEIINYKSKWPKYTIINKYKCSKTEWEKISTKFKDKTANTNGQNAPSSSNFTINTLNINNSNSTSSTAAASNFSSES